MSTSESVRRHARIVDIHQHEEPPESGEPESNAPGAECGGAGGAPAGPGRLWRDDGRIMYSPADGGEPQSVRIVWARPLSGRGGPVSLMRAGKKREIAYLPDLSQLDAASRAVAEEELAESMVLPVITAVYQVKPRFGSYYWDVETNMGRRKFLLSSPESNSSRPGPDVVVIRDVSGNCYEIASVSSMDKTSLREMDRVL